MKNISEINRRENQNTRFMFSNFFPSKIVPFVRDNVKKNMVEPDRRMRIACWIPKATNIRLEYVILVAFPQQQWLHERSSLLRHTYVD